MRARWRTRETRRRSRRWPPKWPRGRRGCGGSPASATSARSAVRSGGWSRSIPLTAQQEFRFKIPPPADGQDVVLSLVATDAGDGNEHDFVVWQQPRLVAPGPARFAAARRARASSRELTARARTPVRPDRQVSEGRRRSRRRAEAGGRRGTGREARRRSRRLRAWLDYLGIGAGGAVELERAFHQQADECRGLRIHSRLGQPRHAAAAGQFVRPARPHPGQHEAAQRGGASLAHAAGGRRLAKPGAATMRIEGDGDARPSRMRQRRDLVAGTAARRHPAAAGQPARRREAKPRSSARSRTWPFSAAMSCRSSIGPRDGNHSCDLTAIDLKIDQRRRRRPNVESGRGRFGRRAGRQSARRPLGNAGVWHFYTEPEQSGRDRRRHSGPIRCSPNGKLAAGRGRTPQLAEASADVADRPTARAERQPRCGALSAVASLGGPLLVGLAAATCRRQSRPRPTAPQHRRPTAPFGPRSGAVRQASGRLAPSTPPACASRRRRSIEIRLPADLAAGCELVATGVLDKQIRQPKGACSSRSSPASPARRRAAPQRSHSDRRQAGNGPTTTGKRRTRSPILVTEGSAARAAHRGGLRRVPPVVPRRPVLHEDRARSMKSSRSRCSIAKTIIWRG